jgi:asparagine synthase (glutamine-hydrolysing)
MCGILGTIPEYNDKNLFNNALSRLNHRGPDDKGVVHFGKASFGHTRLSIIDTTKNGHQPFYSQCNRYIMTFNGELYNYIELKKELKKKGYDFKTDTDTEVLLSSYIEWGESCFNKFNGMWALVIYDSKEDKFIFSRDRFGKKPLFYTHQNHFFIFSSEMKAILPFLKHVKSSTNIKEMIQNVATYESKDYTLIDGIKKIQPGYYAIYKNGSFYTKKYWELLDTIHNVPSKYEDQVEEFKNILYNSVDIRMHSDVSIGTALSGGVDSSAIISIMNKINNSSSNKTSINAFIASFPGTFLDEAKYAEKVANNLNIKPFIFEINPQDYIDKLESYIYFFEEIFHTNIIPMMALYSNIKKHGVTVTLDGHGADEILGGYPGETIYAAVIESIKNLDITAMNNFLDIQENLMPTNKKFNLNKKNKYFNFLKYIVISNIKRLVGRGVKLEKSSHKNYIRLDRVAQFLYHLTQERTLPTLLRNYDRYSMASGVEIRMPFMDHRIVSYAFSLPYTSKIRNGFTKSIIRDSVKDIVPNDVLFRKDKIGFNAPIIEWIKGPMKEFIMDEMASSNFKYSDIINSRELEIKFHEIISGKNESFVNGLFVWKDFMAYLWEKQFILKKGGL